MQVNSFSELLSSSPGLLVSGPKRLIDLYREGLEGVLKTKQVDIEIERPCRFNNLRCLEFDYGYVVCKSVDVVESLVDLDD